MSFFSTCCRLSGLIIAALVLLAPARLAADLVWNPQTGWRVEGGALAGLSGVEGRNALELMNKAREQEERGNAASAIKTYGKVVKKYSNSVYTPEALYRSAHLYLGRKQYTRAFESFQQIVGRYPNSKRFNEIIGEQYRIASALLDGAHGRAWGWFPVMSNRTQGLEYFEYILLNAPYSDYAPLALMNIARGHQKMRNTELAIDALDRMINNYPQSLLTPDAYLKLAQTHASLVDGPYYDQASTKEAITYFQDFMILFPNDANVGSSEQGLSDMRTVLAESKMKMADFYFFKRDNYTAAKVFYNEAITVFPDSPVAQRAKERLAEVEAAAAAHKPSDTTGEQPAEQPKKKKRFFFF
ncbi:MAG: outer membrane protein assembly factor BamD [Opitutaceae bacterium]|nr:outer membrane protein assembly factor BamD [Opitutaceae bacterium]MBP9914027.1 outer membrane protein assembly factor BamD [Opitutaceae bacterium]